MRLDVRLGAREHSGARLPGGGGVAGAALLHRPGRSGGTITDRAEIQALFDSLNALQDTGNDLKDFLRFGSGAGGSVLYEIRMEFPDREPLTLCLASGSGEQPLSDLALAYWFYEKGKTPWIADTCRGSMAVFHQLFAAHVSQTGS